jgi:hypothetical protein
MQLTPEESHRIIEGELARLAAQQGARRKRRLKFVWASVGCLGLIGISAAAVFLPRPYLSAEPIARATPYATYTREPTHTPYPTSRPAVELNAAETEYALETAKIAIYYADALDALSRLLSDAGNDPRLTFDNEWQLNVGLKLAVIKLSGSVLRDLEPPRRFSDVHQDLLEGADHLDKAVDLLATGIDNHDASQVYQAGQEMLLGKRAVDRGKSKLEALTR